MKGIGEPSILNPLSPRWVGFSQEENRVSRHKMILIQSPENPQTARCSSTLSETCQTNMDISGAKGFLP